MEQQEQQPISAIGIEEHNVADNSSHSRLIARGSSPHDDGQPSLPRRTRRTRCRSKLPTNIINL